MNCVKDVNCVKESLRGNSTCSRGDSWAHNLQSDLDKRTMGMRMMGVVDEYREMMMELSYNKD